jgi:hypothetical protein
MTLSDTYFPVDPIRTHTETYTESAVTIRHPSLIDRRAHGLQGILAPLRRCPSQSPHAKGRL